MALIRLDVHNIRSIHCRPAMHKDGKWVDIFINGEDEEIITLFFIDKTLATNVADAINLAAGFVTPDELKPVEPVE